VPSRKEITDAQHARLAPLITEAITVLKDVGKTNLADAVAELARNTPGWAGRGKMRTTAVRVDLELLARLREKFPSRPVADLGREGAELFLGGKVAVHRIARGGTKEPLSIRLTEELFRRLNARCDELNESGKLDFRITPTTVIVSYLESLAPQE
jgi:hypothetical protein